MAKRIFIIILVILLLSITGFTAFLLLNHNQKDPNDKDPLLADTILLESLNSDKSSTAQEKLKRLAGLHNAVGYYANIELARRVSVLDATNYYYKALELYESDDIKRELAASLAKQGDFTDAAKMYASTLPDSISLNSLKSLNLASDTIGQLLLDYNQAQSAEDYLRIEIDKASDVPYLIKLQKLYAKALSIQGKYKDALPLLENLSIKDPGDKDILWWYGRSLEALGQTSKAKTVYNSLGDKGGYRLGLILEKEGKLGEAASAYLRSSDTESRWKGAYLLDKIGSHDKALDVYLGLSKEDGSIYQDDAAYRAYVLMKRNDNSESINVLDVISNEPSWMVRLNREPEWPEITETLYDTPLFMKRADTYKKSGRGEMAKIELSIGEKYASLSDKLAMGDWYLEKEDYYNSIRWGIKALSEKPDMHAFELAYPRPYMEQVKEASTRFGVDPNLIYAVIRCESYFDTNAVSRAGAMGLMQIMPDTGKYIASRLKVSFDVKEILNPDTNIEFGTYYLKSLLDMYSGDVDKAMAAYNGGAGNVKNWSESGIGKTSEDFPTAVAFLETREYITKVQDAYYIYRKFYENTRD